MSLKEKLDSLTIPSNALCDTLDDHRVRCRACAHNCTIPPGERGVCRLRFNDNGKLHVPHGYVANVAVDPVEKKPFYHFLPGEKAFSFGMLGCNFKCGFCQNWITSQTLKDEAAGTNTQNCSARELVSLAQSHGCRIVASTYNEPLITSEWAMDIFQLAKGCGMKTTYVSNGFASPQVLDYLDPWMDAMNVDLKCFTDENYQRLGGRLQPVLDTIRSLHERGKWLEIITLVVPGFNDSAEELEKIAKFIVAVDPEIPWHVSAYHADYKMSAGPRATPYGKIIETIKMGRACGLKHVYGGNLSGLGENANTHCANCGATLITRTGFTSHLPQLKNGRCTKCHTPVTGVWS
jgi:pyruvate formate lyase activating enzyme